MYYLTVNVRVTCQLQIYRAVLSCKAPPTCRFFDDGWGPDKAQGQNVEPGHSFEWVWLLHECVPPSSSRPPHPGSLTGTLLSHSGISC